MTPAGPDDRVSGDDGARGASALLARRLRDAGRGPDDRLSVAEVRRSLLPYPLCREALGLASKAEYDLALLQVFRADGVLESEDPQLEEDVERELGSPEPGLGVLDDHAAVTLRPGPRLAAALRDRPGEGDGRARTGDETASAVVSGASGAGEGTPADCPSCGGEVPDLEGVRYCPRCGAPLAASTCAACGEEMRAGWRHCPFCGSERHV